MGTILSIETSTTTCSVALHNSGEELALIQLERGMSHSEYLGPVIQDVQRYAGIGAKDLDAVAVSAGPGSYTGLRIGVATAKGLCHALEIPLIAVNTLEAMVESIRQTVSVDSWFCPMIDARRMEVYCLVTDGIHTPWETRPVILEEDTFDGFLKSRQVIFFGNGSGKSRALYEGRDHAFYVEGIKPSAREVGILAAAKFKDENFENLAYIEPYYLKQFQAKPPKQQL